VEKEEMSPIPEEITKDENKSLGVSFGNAVGKVGFEGSKGNKTTKKFPKGTEYV
jgi:hypothetical protein